VHTACDFNFIIKGEGLLKVTSSHVHWKSGDISETVQDRHVVTTGHNRSDTRIRPTAANCYDLACPWKSFRYCKLL